MIIRTNVSSSCSQSTNSVNCFVASPKINHYKRRPYIQCCFRGYNARKKNKEKKGEREESEKDDWSFDIYLFLSTVTFCMSIYTIEEFAAVTKCIGPSMIPTFREDGDTVVFMNLDHSKTLFGRLIFNVDDDLPEASGLPRSTDPNPSYRRGFYKKGDAIISDCKDDPNKRVCKRIAAMEGEWVTEGRNGTFPRRIRIPPGHVWLLGDNPSNSRDSRDYGPVPLALIKGKIMFKINFPEALFSEKKLVEWVDHEVMTRVKRERLCAELYGSPTKIVKTKTSLNSVPQQQFQAAEKDKENDRSKVNSSK